MGIWDARGVGQEIRDRGWGTGDEGEGWDCSILTCLGHCGIFGHCCISEYYGIFVALLRLLCIVAYLKCSCIVSLHGALHSGFVGPIAPGRNLAIWRNLVLGGFLAGDGSWPHICSAV